MSFSVNKVILLGNISQDPDLTYTPKGNALLKFSLATNYSVKNNETGEWDDKPSFHRVVVWGKQAEALGNMLHKGDKTFVEGRIEYGSYEGQDGVKRYTTDIIAMSVIPMAGKGQGASQSMSEGGDKPAKKAAPKKKDAEASHVNNQTESVNLDDIPF